MKSMKRIFAIVMVMAMMVGCFAISASAGEESLEPQFVCLNYKAGLQGTANADKTVYDDNLAALDTLATLGVVTTNKPSTGVTEYLYNGVVIFTIDTVKGIGYGNLDATEKENFVYTITDADRAKVSTLTGKNENGVDVNYYASRTSKIYVYSDTSVVIDVAEEYAKANAGEEPTIAVTFSNEESILDYYEILIPGEVLIENEVLEFDDDYVVNSTTKKKYFEVSGAESTLTLILQSGVTAEDNIYWTADADMLAAYADDNYDGFLYKSITFIHGYKEYEIKEANQTATWTQGSTDGATLTSAAEFSTFKNVTVDGTEIDAANYTAKEGSTIVTFTPAYLATLSVGKHTVVINSMDGSATGTLVIAAAPVEEKVADTADNSAIGAFVALGAFAAVGYVSLKKKED